MMLLLASFGPIDPRYGFPHDPGSASPALPGYRQEIWPRPQECARRLRFSQAILRIIDFTCGGGMQAVRKQ